jgi:hypothetical protein
MIKALGGPSSTRIIHFAAQVARYMSTDFEMDLLARFIKEELPFCAFLFYAKVYIEANLADLRKRMLLISDYFGPFGFGMIAREKQLTFHADYCKEPASFRVFCLALYMETIRRIVAAIPPDVDIESCAKEMLRLPPSEMDSVRKYMIAVSGTGSPGAKDLAAVLLERKVPMESLLADFEAEKSDILVSFKGCSKGPEQESLLTLRTRARQQKPSVTLRS